MASRIFWVLAAGLALVTGMVLQDGGQIMAWADESEVRTERAIEAGVERAVVASVDRMQVVGTDGRDIAVTPQTRRALAEAVGRLVKAEAEIAVLGIRDASDAEIQAATVVRDQARTEVETLKAQIERQDQLSDSERAAIRDQIRTTIREDVRDTVRDAVRN